MTIETRDGRAGIAADVGTLIAFVFSAFLTGGFVYLAYLDLTDLWSISSPRARLFLLTLPSLALYGPHIDSSRSTNGGATSAGSGSSCALSPRRTVRWWDE